MRFGYFTCAMNNSPADKCDRMSNASFVISKFLRNYLGNINVKSTEINKSMLNFNLSVEIMIRDLDKCIELYYTQQNFKMI